ncbi:MAG: peptidoglycan editing factor PgeF [Lachnospiraceae bacterium]|nr:peptidoglycan editing factor PgeF [Lachnospiraceae bacterium]
MKIRWKNESGPRLRIREKGEVCWLTYPQIDACGLVRHGFTTRLGGVSEGIWSSMNLSFTRGDKAEHVQENYRRIADAVGFPVEKIVCSDQTHTTNVEAVTAGRCGEGVLRPRTWSDVDGMVTNVPGVVLATFYADCVPLYFVDPVHRAVGLSHSGWRGTVGQIGAVTLRKMHDEYGTDPADVLAAVGPSICQDCYEVSADVAEQFCGAYGREYWPRLFYEKPDGKYQLDLWEACRITLLDAGIRPEHLSMPNLCTCCNPELLFSHRASKGKRGNLAAFLMLENSGSAQTGTP